MEPDSNLHATRKTQAECVPYPPTDSEVLVVRATWAFLLLGLFCRVVRYATHQPLWGDEAYLAASLIDRGFLQLLEPLDYHQVAPPLFLWVELALVRLAGFSEWSLRLFPLLCGVGSLFLFYALVSQFSRGVPRLLACGILAVAFYPIRFSSEVKPYATDLAVALALLLPAALWLRQPDRSRWLWFLAAFTPLALGLSHPAVFVAGGVAVWLLLQARRSQPLAVRLAIAAFFASLLLSFSACFLLVTLAQSESAGPMTFAYWNAGFPPWSTPWRIPVWLVQVHTSHMFAYPVGEARGGSVATTALAAAGVLALWRRGQMRWLSLLLAPFLLGLAAAALGRYPYGGSTRTMQYVAPAICLLAGLGAARLVGRIKTPRAQRNALTAAALSLVILGVSETAIDVALPYKFPEDLRSRAFARSFWPAAARDAEVACVKRVLGRRLDPIHWETGRSAVYLCQQAIYHPHARDSQPVDWGRLSPEHPLRCVLYNLDPDQPLVRDWLAQMSRSFQLLRHKRYEPIPVREVGGLPYRDCFEVFDFAPRNADDLAAFLTELPDTGPTRRR